MSSKAQLPNQKHLNKTIVTFSLWKKGDVDVEYTDGVNFCLLMADDETNDGLKLNKMTFEYGKIWKKMMK